MGSVSASGISLLEAPVECPNAMSHVERYHGPLRHAYLKLEASLPKSSAADLLQTAVFCVNSTVGPEGLCPMLCVFGAMPHPARGKSAPEQIERAKAIDAAMKEVERDHAKRKLSFAARYRGPYGKESCELDELHFGAPILVYRKTSSTWEGPFRFISKEGETVCVQLPRGRKIFRSNVVKPFKQSTSNEKVEQVLSCFYSDKTSPDFKTSRQKELQGLIKQGVFKVVKRSSVPSGTRIYGSRFVDSLKQKIDGTEFEKSRLVARNFKDKAALKLPTRSPTISRMGQRLFLSLVPAEPKLKPYNRDVTQAYTQSKYQMGRIVYLEPVPEMELPDDVVLLVVKPLYGIPEAGLHWYLTYKGHHTETLGMKQCTFDQCIMYKPEKDCEVPNMVMLQVDDTVGAGTDEFLALEECTSKEFMTKDRELLHQGRHMKFNGAYIARTESGYSMHMENRLQKLEKPKTMKEANSRRARVQYISTMCRPDLCSPSNLLSADIAANDPNSVSSVSDLVDYCISTADMHLNFVKLDLKSARIVLFTDAAFANSSEYASQLGFVVLLVDKLGKANIVHYGSGKCHRVTRSVMAAELLSLVNGYDHAFVIRHTLYELLGRYIPIDAYVDSKTTFNCVAKSASTQEKRLQIDVSSLREALHCNEIRKIAWISGKQNPADGLTRNVLPSPYHPLLQVLKTNRLDFTPLGWSEQN